MTREEASYILRKFYADGYKSNNYNALEKALKIAVICLENLPHWISVEFPHWISVFDETPKVDMLILVVQLGKVTTFRYQYERAEVLKNAFGITHWMPLPQPPKEGCELSNGKEIEIECDYE